MRTHSIYAGFLVHATVAVLNDVLALYRRGSLPVSLTPLGSRISLFLYWTSLIWVAWGLALAVLALKAWRSWPQRWPRSEPVVRNPSILGVPFMSTARRPKSWPLCALVLAAAAVGCAKGNEATGAAGSGGSTGAAGSGGGFNPYASYAAKALHAQGNKIVDTTGATVRLLGVNRSGSEYMCVPPTSGSYVFDGATGPSTIAGMKAWHINTVRLPLTESCWLGINGALVTAEHYREEVTNYMLQLHANGIYVVLDLHWSAPGTTAIRGGSGGNQLVTMAFADHALDFWTSVAATFKDDPMVIFDLFNEPILNASDRMGHRR